MGFPGNIAIVGLGMMGTSLAMALKNRTDLPVYGWDENKDARNFLSEYNIIDFTSEYAEDVIRDVDVTVLCLPISVIIRFVKKYAPIWKKNAIVTDIGSIKKNITEQLDKYLWERSVNFIGGHPMAGTEKTGYKAGKPGLYENRVVFLTPTVHTSVESKEIIKRLWQKLGSHVIEISPELHDIVMAHSSHISHVISYCLVLSVLSRSYPFSHEIQIALSSAFKDMSRVASSSPEMWKEIIDNNRNNILKALEVFENTLHNLKNLIRLNKSEDIRKVFAQAKYLRDEWLNLHLEDAGSLSDFMSGGCWKFSYKGKKDTGSRAPRLRSPDTQK